MNSSGKSEGFVTDGGFKQRIIFSSLRRWMTTFQCDALEKCKKNASAFEWPRRWIFCVALLAGGDRSRNTGIGMQRQVARRTAHVDRAVSRGSHPVIVCIRPILEPARFDVQADVLGLTGWNTYPIKSRQRANRKLRAGRCIG